MGCIKSQNNKSLFKKAMAPHDAPTARKPLTAGLKRMHRLHPLLRACSKR
ncbi:hypothetical protein SAMN05421736_1183 [Evansella caseinilytica]|uniref:Uncharacterized protein n=1 Tax=Evansella caseinilytica TaxID=1503961 RepID=A0A1H3U2Q0_9BACI|nr:hypothetical protein SAMN05421736_1183 [Evansella caseinilytica]